MSNSIIRSSKDLNTGLGRLSLIQIEYKFLFHTMKHSKNTVLTYNVDLICLLNQILVLLWDLTSSKSKPKSSIAFSLKKYHDLNESDNWTFLNWERTFSGAWDFHRTKVEQAVEEPVVEGPDLHTKYSKNTLMLTQLKKYTLEQPSCSQIKINSKTFK